MSFETLADPREQPLPPTQEEIDDWATREHKRRAAWLAGPSEEERHGWARRFRWGAMLGWEESRLGPTEEDVSTWAAREHKRRQAWLAGPSEAEKRSWASRRQRLGAESDSPNSQESAEEWAARERQRRQEWLAGPTQAEKDAWARRQGGGFLDDLASLPARLESDLPEGAQQFLREAELVGKGAVYALSRGPLALWSYLTRHGRTFEQNFYQQPRRRRVRY